MEKGPHSQTSPFPQLQTSLSAAGMGPAFPGTGTPHESIQGNQPFPAGIGEWGNARRRKSSSQIPLPFIFKGFFSSPSLPAPGIPNKKDELHSRLQHSRLPIKIKGSAEMGPRGTHYPKPSPSCSPQRWSLGRENSQGQDTELPSHRCLGIRGFWEPPGPWQRGDPCHAMPSRQREPHFIHELASATLSTDASRAPSNPQNLPPSPPTSSVLNPSQPQGPQPHCQPLQGLIIIFPSSFLLFHPFPIPFHLAHPRFHPIASARFPAGRAP